MRPTLSKLVICLTAMAVCVQSYGQVFMPDGATFFRQAVEEYGILPGLVFTADRITRANKIGLAGQNMLGEDGHIHEGLEAYIPSRASAQAIKNIFSITPLPAKPSGGSGLNAASEIDFVDYLIGNSLYADAVTLMSNPTYIESDTLRYLRGWVNYSSKRLEQACAEFTMVPINSPYYDKSLFFNTISNAHLGRYDRCVELLDSYSGPYRELESLERAGIALLRGDAAAYITAAKDFSFSQYALTESEEKLQEIYKARFIDKKKSPALAAISSALVPGLGKIYVGELGEGVSSFMCVGALAGLTAENWIKCGSTNWKTIMFGTLGAIFYLGNIYGSYVSVSIHDNFIKDAQDTAILYHIHIPLRSIFN